MRGFSTLKTPLARSIFLACCFWLLPLTSTAQRAPVTISVDFGENLPFGSGCVPRSTLCDGERNSFNLLNQLVLPSIESNLEREEQNEQNSQPTPKQPRVLGGMLRYERVEIDNNRGRDLDRDIYSTSVQLIWDVHDFSLGVLIPYDFLNLDDFDIHRIGAVAFGQYHLEVSDQVMMAFTLNSSYMHDAVSAQDIDDVNTFGTGVSASITLDQQTWVVGGALSYQFSADDSGQANDHQHLFKLGLNGGMRFGEQAAVTLFTIWSYDATDHETATNVDRDYFDLGLEGTWSLSATWKLTGGYKKVLGLDDFDSNMVFLGTLLRF